MRDAGDTPVTVVVVARDGTEVVVMQPRAGGLPDLGLLDALARLQLVASRHGCRVAVRGAPPALRGLAELVGLASVLRLEPVGQPELREELGVEEVVEGGDAAA